LNIYKNICNDLDQKPIKNINGQDPFEYINNFCGTFISTKNDHGTFSFKLRLNNFVSLSDCLFDFTEPNSDLLGIGFEEEEGYFALITKYMFTSEIEIPEENNNLRALSSGKGFYNRDFYLNKRKNNKKNKSIKNTEKNKNTKKKNVSNKKNKIFRNLATTINWNYRTKDKFFSCYEDYRQ